MQKPPQRGRGWRVWIAVLAIALVGATSAADAWHEEHAGDTDCAVCQLRHQPADTLPGSIQFEPADIAEPPARAPPHRRGRLRPRPPAPRPRTARVASVSL